MQLERRKQSLLVLTSMLMGLLFIILLKVNGVAGSQVALQDRAVPNLVQLEQENQQLSVDNETLQLELAKYAQGQSASTLANERLQEVKMNAGLIGVTDPGLRITLDDSKRRAVGKEDQMLFIIHEGDIRGIFNALWNGGAEAIAVNGQRVTINTEVYCLGSYIQINGTRQMPPYVIEAIGDTNILLGAFNFYGWFKLADLEQQTGITRKLEIVDKVVIPAGKLRDYHFAELVKEVGTDPQIIAQQAQLQMYKGMLAVEGPGIQIRIDDRKASYPLYTDDLATMINTLKFAGAEAISINDQRLISSTAIVLSGSTIMVNKVPINRPEGIPYELNVIGDKDTLFDYFSKLEAPNLKLKGMTVSIVRKKIVFLPTGERIHLNMQYH